MSTSIIERYKVGVRIEPDLVLVTEEFVVDEPTFDKLYNLWVGGEYLSLTELTQVDDTCTIKAHSGIRLLDDDAWSLDHDIVDDLYAAGVEHFEFREWHGVERWGAKEIAAELRSGMSIASLVGQLKSRNVPIEHGGIIRNAGGHSK